MTTTANYVTANRVDTIDDLQGLGYSDSRKLAQDSKGNLYIAYRKMAEQGSKERYHIFVGRSSDGGQSWESTPIEQTGDYTQRVPSIAVDSHDRIHVVWYGLDLLNRGQQHQIKYTQSVDGGLSWHPWQNIAHVAKYKGQPEWQQHPTIYVDGKDRLYVTWDGLDGEHNTPQTKFIRSINGGKTWSKWANVQAGEENHSRPTLVAAGSTLYLLTYGAVDNLQQILWSRSKDGGKSWSVWQPIASSNRDQRHISVAVDSQERLHVAWRQQRKNRDDAVQVHYTSYDGKTWQAPEIISPSRTRYQFFPSITLCHTHDANDQPVDVPYILWSEIDHASGYPKDAPYAGTAYYAYLTEKNEWSESSRLRDSLTDIYPSFARHFQTHQKPEQPMLGLVWLDNSGNQQQIEYGEIALEQLVYTEDVVEPSVELSPENEPENEQALNLEIENEVVQIEQSIEPSEIDNSDQPVATQEVAQAIAQVVEDDDSNPFDDQPLSAIDQEVDPQTPDEIEAGITVEESAEVEAHPPEHTFSGQPTATQEDAEIVAEDEPDELDEASSVAGAQETGVQEIGAPASDEVIAEIEIEDHEPEQTTSTQPTDIQDVPEVVADGEPSALDEADVKDVELAEPLVDATLPSQSEYLAGIQINDQPLQSSQVVEDDSGTLYAVYCQNFKVRKDFYKHVFCAQSQDQGQTWETSVHPVAKIGAYEQITPTIEIDKDDILHVVWSGMDTLNRTSQQIKYAQSQDQGKNWSLWKNIAKVKIDPEAEERDQRQPAIVVGPENTLYIAWQGTDVDQPNPSIKLIHSTDQGKTWSDWQNITPPENGCSQPTLLVTDDNVLQVTALQHTDESTEIIKSQSSDQGKSWSAWEVVSSDHPEISDNVMSDVFAKAVQPPKLVEDESSGIEIESVEIESIEASTSDIALSTDDDPDEVWENAAEDIEAKTSQAAFDRIWEDAAEDIAVDAPQPDFDLEGFAADYVTVDGSESFATEIVDETGQTEELSGLEDIAQKENQAEARVEARLEEQVEDKIESPKEVAAEATEEIIFQENIATDDMDDIFAAVTDFFTEDDLPSGAIDADSQEILASTDSDRPDSDRPASEWPESEQPLQDAPSQHEDKQDVDLPPLLVERPELATQEEQQPAQLTWPTQWRPNLTESTSEPEVYEDLANNTLAAEVDPSYIWPQVVPPPEEEIDSSQLTTTYADQGPAFTLERRVSFWATYFGLNITPIEVVSENGQIASDQVASDQVASDQITSDQTALFYVVKHIFTTRDGSWEPSEQPGSIPVWASQTYADPLQWQTLSNTENNHCLFGAVVGPHGDFMPTETMQLGAHGLSSPQVPSKASEYLNQSGWHYAPFSVDSRYQPTYQTTDQHWRWTPAVGSAEHVLGSNLPDDCQIAIYVVWQAVPAKEMEPSPLLSSYV